MKIEKRLKSTPEGKQFWLYIDGEVYDLLGEPMLCQKCKGIMKFPIYYCGNKKKCFCAECELSPRFIDTCGLQRIKDHHKHHKIMNVIVEK